MTQRHTVTPERYESPEIEMLGLVSAGILCQSDTTAPEGFDWEDWNN